MLRSLRKSLLAQLLGGYLLFVALVFGGGLALSFVVQRQLLAGSRAADLALATTVALETAGRLDHAREAVAALAMLDSVRQGDQPAMDSAFTAFLAARPDVDRVYWLDPQGVMAVSVPTDPRTIGTDYSEERLFRHARQALGPFVESGVVDLTTFNGVVVVAHPVRDDAGQLTGVVATNLLLDDLSAPLRTVVADQVRQDQPLLISLVDAKGQLIASPERERLLQPVLDELSGAREALAGRQATTIGPGPRGEQWLFSATPVPGAGWAVVVQRPVATALAAITSVQLWLAAALVVGALGGLSFWLVLHHRVIYPLGRLAARYAALSATTPAPSTPPLPTSRSDELGALARTLHRLEGDVGRRLAELHTLLETSSAVVSSLDPAQVATTVISQVQRLVDVQAAAVLVSDEGDALRVLASAGRSSDYDASIHIALDDPHSPTAVALREGRPVQMIAGRDAVFPTSALDNGLHTILAIPIDSRHAGGVALLVSRIEAQPFSAGEIDLLLAFANHAALAWENAVLYEHSDEQLRVVARENERLYRQALQANQFKSTLLAAVGHELRTPLAGIKGHASTLLEDDVDWSPAEQRHFLQTISDEADRLAGMVSNLLDLSRQEAGLLLLHPAQWPVDDLVDMALARLGHPASEILRQIPPAIPPVTVDRSRIEVVLRNLIANALVYGDSRVWISATAGNGEVMVCVHDDGPGIPPEELPHIFERFYRAGHGVSRRAGGSGLGLAICRAFVEAHGGRIWAESGGDGTTFAFTLPAAEQGGGQERQVAA